MGDILPGRGSEMSRKTTDIDTPGKHGRLTSRRHAGQDRLSPHVQTAEVKRQAEAQHHGAATLAGPCGAQKAQIWAAPTASAEECGGTQNAGYHSRIQAAGHAVRQGWNVFGQPPVVPVAGNRRTRRDSRTPNLPANRTT